MIFYYWYYYLLGIILLPGVIFSIYAQTKVSTSFNRYKDKKKELFFDILN